MQDAANLLLGTVIFVALVTLSALILLRGKRRKNDDPQIDRRDTYQTDAEAVTDQQGKTSFLGKIFGIFRRNKTTVEPEAFAPELTQTLEALEAISEIQAAGEQEEEKFPELTRSTAEEEKFPELTRSSSEEELTEAEVNVFKGLIPTEESDGKPSAEAEESGESSDAEDGLFGSGDNSLLGAFKSVTVVDEVRKALLARVEPVELKDLAEEISSLTSRVKVYVPDDAES